MFPRDCAPSRRSFLSGTFALTSAAAGLTMFSPKLALSEASDATMTILHLVHEGNATDFAAKMADFSSAAVTRRWKAGESDIGTSLAHPRWLAPPPRLSGIVVHELRGGVAAPSR